MTLQTRAPVAVAVLMAGAAVACHSKHQHLYTFIPLQRLTTGYQDLGYRIGYRIRYDKYNQLKRIRTVVVHGMNTSYVTPLVVELSVL